MIILSVPGSELDPGNMFVGVDGIIDAEFECISGCCF